MTDDGQNATQIFLQVEDGDMASIVQEEEQQQVEEPVEQVVEEPVTPRRGRGRPPKAAQTPKVGCN